MSDNRWGTGPVAAESCICPRPLWSDDGQRPGCAQCDPNCKRCTEAKSR